MGHAESKTRSLDQLLEKPYELFSSHSFDPVFMELCQNVCHHLILTGFETESYLFENKVTRSELGKKLVYTLKGTFFYLNFMNLFQNVYFHQI